MRVKFTEIQNAVERKKINELYVKSVPAHEKSFVYFFWLKKGRKNVLFVNIYDDNKWVGFVFLSFNKDIVYVWFFATLDADCSREYESAMFSEIKRLYPSHCIVLSIEAENLNGDNAKQSMEGKQFYEKIGFRETSYFVKRADDSFAIMFIGKTFHIEQFYSIHKEMGWLTGGLMVRSHKKQLQKRK